MNYEEDHDKKLEKAIEDFENALERKRAIIHVDRRKKKMSRSRDIYDD